MNMEVNASLASGSPLTAETWAEFKKRLHHDCVGAGVHDHCTASAIFIVQARRLVYGIDPDYGPELVVMVGESEWFSPQEYWDDLDEEGRAAIDGHSQEWCSKNFLDADTDDQWHVLGELDNHTVTGWTERWEYVNAHFTKDAAEAFIRRKKHDYRKGLRVYVDCQNYAWEFEAIKEAILKGELVYQSKEA